MPFYCDYHVHCRHSFDADSTILSMAEAAESAGLAELCFSDHLEFEYPPWNVPFDPAARLAELQEAQERIRIPLLHGAEIGLTPDPAHARQGWEHIRDTRPDFIIGSIHIVGEQNVFDPPYFSSRTRTEAYGEYLAAVEASIRTLPELSVLGHYDFVAKSAPYTPRPLCYADAPEQFDAILRYLAENGKGLEINTAVWRNAPGWGQDVLTRFAQLGGEFVTFGSDGHIPAKVGYRFREAYALAQAAGIRYTATFRSRVPTFIRL